MGRVANVADGLQSAPKPSVGVEFPGLTPTDQYLVDPALPILVLLEV